jgi:hypothetical protein
MEPLSSTLHSLALVALALLEQVVSHEKDWVFGLIIAHYLDYCFEQYRHNSVGWKPEIWGISISSTSSNMEYDYEEMPTLSVFWPIFSRIAASFSTALC